MNFTVIFPFVFLEMVTDKDSGEWHSLDPQYDKTEYQMNKIMEIFDKFNEQTFINSHEEWNSQNGTLEQSIVTTDSKITHFSKLDTIKDIISPSRFFHMECIFGKTLQIDFQRQVLTNPTELEGYVQYIKSSPCRARFSCIIDSSKVSFYFKTVNQFTFEHLESPRLELDKIVLRDIKVQFDEELCNDTNMRQSQQIYTDVQFAFRQTLMAQFKHNLNPTSQTILNKCLTSKLPKHDILERKRENHYVRFKIECNTAAFPWLTDCNELIIRGLDNLLSSRIYKIFKSQILVFGSVKIRWNVMSTIPKVYNIVTPTLFIMKRYKNDVTNNNGDLPEVTFLKWYASLIHYYTSTHGAELDQKLTELLEKKIEEAYAKTPHVTEGFTRTIKKILQPFDKQTVRNSFVDLEITTQENMFEDTAYSLKIETEGFRIENTTCVSENVNISTLSYKNIRAQFTYFHSIKKDNGNNLLRVFVEVRIKEPRIYISLQRYPTSEIEAYVRIDDNFDKADTTITIASRDHRLKQAERRSIGESIFEKFSGTIRSKILKAANSTLHPVVNICKHSWIRSKEPHSNHFSDRHPYFSKIVDYWVNSVNPFSIQRIDIIINGTWNFKFINVRHMAENIVVDGLRLENVTGRINIRQEDDSNDTWSLNYNMGHFSLIINHTDQNIKVQLPPPSEYWIGSSEFSPPPKNAVDVMEKFKYTVESYIEQSIYYNSDGSDYRAKFQTAQSIMKKSSEDMPLKYEVSSILTNWLVQVLREWYRALRNEWSVLAYNPLKSVILEEFCDCEVHSEGESIGFFDVKKRVNCPLYDPEISCKSRINRATDTSYEENKGTSQLSIDRDGIEVTDDLSQPITSFLKDPSSENYTRAYFCESYFNKLQFSEKHFYLINGTSTYTSDYFFMYQIRIYGWHNLKSFHFKINQFFQHNQFEMIVENLTTHIIWIHNIGDIFSKIPKEMKLKIDKIIIAGETKMAKLLFINRSQMFLSDQENSKMVEILKETLVPIILKSIESSIVEEYLKL